MNKVLLKEQDLQFLLQWRDEHKDLVRLGVAPMKAIKIICADSGFTITGVRKEKELRLTVNENGRGIGNLTFELMEDGLCKLVKDTTKLNQENRQAVLTVYCSVMALIVFGKSTVDIGSGTAREKRSYPTKPTKSPKRSKRNVITYILVTNGNELQMMAKGSHRSPHGSFSVRGHYRHYKSGKVVWIDEYTKGSGEKKDKTYKVGLQKVQKRTGQEKKREE